MLINLPIPGNAEPPYVSNFEGAMMACLYCNLFMHTYMTSFYLSVWLCIFLYLSICLCIFLYLSVCLFMFLCLSVCVSFSICQSVISIYSRTSSWNVSIQVQPVCYQSLQGHNPPSFNSHTGTLLLFGVAKG